MKMKKMTRENYIYTLAFATLAAQRYAEAKRYEIQMATHLGRDGEDHYCGHVSDWLFSGDPTNLGGLHDALRKEGFAVPAEFLPPTTANVQPPEGQQTLAADTPTPYTEG